MNEDVLKFFSHDESFNQQRRFDKNEVLVNEKITNLAVSHVIQHSQRSYF
jgi:hypothetical protein